MDSTVLETMVEMGTALTELAVKGTASAVNKKIQANKNVKDAEQLRTTYDSLLNEVLQEREEAVRIAQAYKSELERIEISDDDIQHLHATITSVLDIFKTKFPNNDVESLEALKNLITVDTLKTMQLLGFNYKKAIGEPLTELCADAISNLGKSRSEKQKPAQSGRSARK